MAKLMTDHDPLHVHKVLGLLVLIHMLYRTGLWIYRGYMFCSFSIHGNQCSTKELQFDVACNILHLLLSWSSLLLPLPAKRNFTSPMIWKEFRWHSITFATRSVAASVIAILGWWPTNWALNYAAKLALVMTTCYAADFATAKYGNREQRTTNAMPYPDCITEQIERGIKLNYAIAQFAATIFCCMEWPDLAWTALVAIQGAPLLMTLVRKGKVTALFYHRAYIAQLMLPFVTFTVANLIHWDKSLMNWQLAVVGFLAKDVTSYLRIWKRCSKWTTWIVGVALVNMALYWEPAQQAVAWLTESPYGLATIAVLYIDFTMRRIISNFLPIFTFQTYNFKMPEEYVQEWLDFVRYGKWNVNVTVGSQETKKAA